MTKNRADNTSDGYQSAKPTEPSRWASAKKPNVNATLLHAAIKWGGVRLHSFYRVSNLRQNLNNHSTSTAGLMD